jgi:hypothetical protein
MSYSSLGLIRSVCLDIRCPSLASRFHYDQPLHTSRSLLHMALPVRGVQKQRNSDSHNEIVVMHTQDFKEHQCGFAN